MIEVNSPKRNQAADILKGIAVLFMISVHVTRLFAKSEITAGAFGKIAFFLGGPTVAPLYLGIMGYFIYSSQKRLKEEMRRGLSLVVLGLLLNFGLNANLIVSQCTGRLNLPLNIFNYLFGVDILHTAGFSIIIIAALKRTRLKFQYLLLITAALFPLDSLLTNLLSIRGSWGQYLAAYFWGDYEHSYFPLIPWLAYPLAGYIIADIHTHYPDLLKQKPARAFIKSITLVLLVFSAEYYIPITHNLHDYYNHNILFFLWTIFFLLGYIAFVNEYAALYPNILFTYFAWLGKNVTAVYIIQWLLIGNLATEIYQSQTLPFVIFWIIAIIITSSAICYAAASYGIRAYAARIVRYFINT